MKKLKELLNDGYVRVNEKFRLTGLEGYEAQTEDVIIDLYLSNLSEHEYVDPKAEVFIYYAEDGELSINHFLKIKDKFEDSDFVNEDDKEIISEIIGRKDINGKPIKLGDTVSCMGYLGRVVWLNSGFFIYDDAKDENVMHLCEDSRMEKIN